MVNIFILLIIFHLLFFSFFLLTRKDARKKSHSLLALFFFSLAINLFNGYCFHSIYIFQNFPHAFFIGAPFAFLYAPTFYVYVKSLTEIDYGFRKKDLLHGLPFMLFFIYLLFAFHLHSTLEKQLFIKQNSVKMWLVLMPFLQITVLVYVIAIIKSIMSFRLRIKNVFSSIDQVNYSWLKFIIIGLALLWFADLSRFLSPIWVRNYAATVEVIFYSCFLILSYLILYKALTQPEIFSSIPELPQKKKKSLSDELNQKYLTDLIQFMETEKPYLESSLTLYDLSEKTSIPHRSLSDVINNSLNQNFYDFVNSYRVKEAQRLMVEKSEKHKTILEVLYSSGFGTKSSFNQAFKKHTGKTPTQFKKNIS